MKIRNWHYVEIEKRDGRKYHEFHTVSMPKTISSLQNHLILLNNKIKVNLLLILNISQ